MKNLRPEIHTRSIIPLAALGILVAAVAWAVSSAALPPADLTMVNPSEIKSIDPALVTGVPEARVITSVFEGLVRYHPRTLEPLPAAAERWEVSPDARRYTFHLRSGAVWSDGSPVVAEDFRWSMRRLLDPLTASQYSYQLWYVRGAKKYARGDVQPGDAVEVELEERPAGARPFARGRLVYGRLTGKPQALDGGVAGKAYVVAVDGRERRFATVAAAGAEQCLQVLPDFRQVAIRAPDQHTLEIELENPTHYFLSLLATTPLRPVQPKCIETHGYPAWTKPANFVSNGPFLLQSRRIRDRLRLVKNPTYWNRANIHLNVVDVLAIESTVTALNLYLTGKADWVQYVPNTVISELRRGRKDFRPGPEFSSYFYWINVTRPPLDDVRVRRAMALAVDREEIIRTGSRGGELPLRSLVPPLSPGYQSAECPPENVKEARRLLAEAGYPGGRGLPRLTILYNPLDVNQGIAELIQDQWKRNLGIRVDLQSAEWGAYLNSLHSLDYQIGRAAWTGDYLDPNSFLDMLVTGGTNNNAGWSSPQYDRLIRDAAREVDPKKRLRLLHEAEVILMRELPVIPLYCRISTNLVRETVKGFYWNVLDEHPLEAMSIDRNARPAQAGEARTH